MSTTKNANRYLTVNGYTDVQDDNPIFTNWGKTNLLQRTRTGSSNPKWKTQVENHENATTGLSGTWMSQEIQGRVNSSFTYHFDVGIGYDSRATLRKEYVRGDLAAYMQSPMGLPTNATWDSDVDGRASNRYLSEARKLVTSMSAPTFLGELKQTLRMLRHPMEALGQSCERYYKELRKRKLDEQRRRRRKGLPELPKDSPKWEWLYAAPGLWLEYSFGWVPLMMDVNDALNTLDHLTDKDRTVKLSKGANGSKLITQSSRSTGVPGGRRTKCQLREKCVETTQVRYRGDVVARAATTYAEKGARWGFTPSEFVPTAWELLPWSFLVDYFASIGDYLDATFADTSSLKWTCRTIRRQRLWDTIVWVDKGLTEGSVPAGGAPVCNPGDPSRSLFLKRVVDRQPGIVPSPSLVFTFAEQSSRHLANMSALLGMFATNLHSQRRPTEFAFRR